MCADAHTVERTVFTAAAMIGTLLYGAVNAFVCMTSIHTHDLLSFDFIHSMSRQAPIIPVL